MARASGRRRLQHGTTKPIWETIVSTACLRRRPSVRPGRCAACDASQQDTGIRRRPVLHTVSVLASAGRRCCTYHVHLSYSKSQPQPHLSACFTHLSACHSPVRICHSPVRLSLTCPRATHLSAYVTHLSACHSPVRLSRTCPHMSLTCPHVTRACVSERQRMRHPAIPAGRTTPANLLRQRQRIAATKYNHAIVMSLIMFLDACKHRNKNCRTVHYQYAIVIMRV